MPTTVYFATNRVISGPTDDVNNYQPVMVPPSMPTAMTYGTAFIDGIDVASNTQGTVSLISDVSPGRFSAEALGDLSDPGRNLLVFIHGFDNTFSDALTRAAFNREWLAGSGAAHADMSVVAFSWPSKGQLIGFPIPQSDYLFDQNMARHSGLHTMTFFANLEPLLRAARARGRKTILLAHSMGNLALEYGVANWFLHGNGDAPLFDEVILAAGDCGYDVFGQPNLAGMSGLGRLATKVSIYYSGVDHVLQLSTFLNGAQRLGQNGPNDKSDQNRFPPAQFVMQDCSQYQDYDFDFLTSHQYYRWSPAVRRIIAAGIG